MFQVSWRCYTYTTRIGKAQVRMYQRKDQKVTDQAIANEGGPQPHALHSRLVMGKSLDSPEKRNVDEMSEKCWKMSEKCQKLSGGAENTIFGHYLDKFCLFGRCFCLVTLSNARPLQLEANSRLHQCLLEWPVLRRPDTAGALEKKAKRADPQRATPGMPIGLVLRGLVQVISGYVSIAIRSTHRAWQAILANFHKPKKHNI